MQNLQKVDYFRHLNTTVGLAIEEDVGSGDITAQLIPENQMASAEVICREQAIVCGRPWFDEVFRQIDEQVTLDWHANEGQLIQTDEKIVSIYGNARSILTAERAALNFLQTLMATATTAHTYASSLSDSSIRLLDTRKTIPGLRLAQKYAVKIGGCENHRIGLYDAFLIKENHIAACGSITAAIEQAKSVSSDVLLEIEVENIEELDQALEAGADRIMLDNFSPDMLEEAGTRTKGATEYELSGNLDLNALKQNRLNQIDFASSGALTKNIQAVDLSLRLTTKKPG